MTVNIRNLDWLRSVKVDGHPEFGARLSETIRDLITATTNIEQQTNADASGNPAPPPPLQAVTATPTSSGHHISINHGGEFYRGAYYHVEYADNPHFTNPFPAYSGPAREIDLATGGQKLYFQAFASYQASGNTSPVYHGGITPLPVTGGTIVARGTSQGGGTGQPGQGLQGFGSIAFRSATGKPPGRGTA